MISAISLAVLVFAPAVLALAYACYSMVKFLLSRRGVSLKNELTVGALGIFAIFVPKLLTSDSKKFLKRFLVSGGLFCLYSAILVFWANSR